MFYYSLALGALFMVMVHHLTDAGWSVGIRRFCEHLASLLFPWLLILFLPVGLFGSKIYSWMKLDPATNNLVAAKYAGVHPSRFLDHLGAFSSASGGCLSSRLRALSLEQDETGAAECTRKMRFHSGWGIVAFAPDADLLRRALDAGRAISVVLRDLRRVFLRQQRLGRAGRRSMCSAVFMLRSRAF